MAQNIAPAGFIATPANSSDITTSCWLKTNTAGSDMPIQGRHNADASATSGYYLAFAGTTGQVNVVSKNGSTFVINGTGTASIRDGLWHHVAFVYRQSNGTVTEFWVDGVLDFSQTAGSAHGGASRPVKFGDVDSLFSGFPDFSGALAEMAVWTTLLTADEIRALSKGFRPDRVKLGGLQFYIPAVRQVYDVRGNTISTANASVADHPRIF